MAKRLDVIVHEYAVDSQASLGSFAAQAVQREIQSIRSDGLGAVVEIEGAPRDLSSSMPPLADGLEVWVSGAFQDLCVASQLLSLKVAGYNARFNFAACLKGESELPADVRDSIIERFPDFYD